MEQATFRNLILRDVEAANAEEAIRKVGQRFYDEGFVKDTYIDAVVAREKNYATGLQLADIAVAMPHTDPQHVNRPGVCIAQLKHPVEFEHMGDPDTKVQAEMLFMMAIKNPDEQVELLQKVLGVFQQPLGPRTRIRRLLRRRLRHDRRRAVRGGSEVHWLITGLRFCSKHGYI